jgi:hypothetical protein
MHDGFAGVYENILGENQCPRGKYLMEKPGFENLARLSF